MDTVKIVISPGWGAGWSTWSSKPKEVAEYQPIVKIVEAGGSPSAVDIGLMKSELGLNFFYDGGIKTLEVVEVPVGGYYVDEYDGFESVKTKSEFW